MALVKYRIRRDTDDNWSANNPVLADGEFGYIKDKNILKVGDGQTPFTQLPGIAGDGNVPADPDQTNMYWNGTPVYKQIFDMTGAFVFDGNKNSYIYSNYNSNPSAADLNIAEMIYGFVFIGGKQIFRDVISLDAVELLAAFTSDSGDDTLPASVVIYYTKK